MGEESGFIAHPAPSEATPSAEMPYLVGSEHPSPFLEAENVECLMPKICSAYFVLSRRAPETVLDLARMSLGWLRKVLSQERALRGRQAAPTPEVGWITEINDKGNKAVVDRDCRPVKRSSRE